MSKLPKQIAVQLNDGRQLDLSVEEFHPYEPAAYVTDPGWSCFDGETEYFISLSGIVYLQPANIEVGIAPEAKKAADDMERQLSEAAERD
jgi:hypothetical protein